MLPWNFLAIMNIQVSKNRSSLLIDAFEILMRNLGAEKTSQLWQILAPSKTIYTSIRQKIFHRKNLDTLYKEAKRFNRK